MSSLCRSCQTKRKQRSQTTTLQKAASVRTPEGTKTSSLFAASAIAGGVPQPAALVTTLRRDRFCTQPCVGQLHAFRGRTDEATRPGSVSVRTNNGVHSKAPTMLRSSLPFFETRCVQGPLRTSVVKPILGVPWSLTCSLQAATANTISAQHLHFNTDIATVR